MRVAKEVKFHFWWVMTASAPRLYDPLLTKIQIKMPSRSLELVYFFFFPFNRMFAHALIDNFWQTLETLAVFLFYSKGDAVFTCKFFFGWKIKLTRVKSKAMHSFCGILLLLENCEFYKNVNIFQILTYA